MLSNHTDERSRAASATEGQREYDRGSIYDQLAEARAEVRMLREMLGGFSVARWTGVRLGPRPTLMLSMLVTGRTYSTEQFLDALQARFPRDAERCPKCVGVNIHRIRAALRWLDPPVFVGSAYRQGYWMDARDRALLDARGVAPVRR